MPLQSDVYSQLSALKTHDDAAKLFSLLNYEYTAQTVSIKRFPSSLDGKINTLQILAGHEDFKIFHCEVDQLILGVERPIIDNLLKDHPYSLFLFSDASKNAWHFINVKYDEEETRRKLFRRIVVGPDERLHTAAQRIALLEIPDTRTLSPLELQQQHDKAFDVEVVTKEFFNSFVQMFHLLREEIEELNPRYKAKSAEFSQMLLNRLMFLYFIQKKGWLDGNTSYLYERYRKGYKDQQAKQTYYSEVLLLIFKKLANTDLQFKQLGSIPFLNGGLFESDPWEDVLKISNGLFGKLFKDLFEHYNFTVREDTAMDMEVAIDPEMLGKVFENLILQLEKDPTTDLRKATGSYYTPRVIVHFMCQQSMKEYLIENGISDSTDQRKKEPTREKIEKLFSLNPALQLTNEEISWLKSSFTHNEAERIINLILNCRVCDPAVGSGAFVVGMLHEMVAIIKLLDMLLMGLGKIQERNYDYELKRKIIEYCLYGVDIQEQAVRICELRLWLSLVVDYQGKDIPPLPNLSYRIRQGNSLIDKLFGYPVNLNISQATERGEKLKQLIDSIQNDKHAYFYESDIQKKRKAELGILAKQCDLATLYLKLRQDVVSSEYESKYGKGLFGYKELRKAEQEEKEILQKEKKELEKLILQSKKTKEILLAVEKGKLTETEKTRQLNETFVWRLDFAEVFKEKTGFDLMIANPPYVSFGLRGNKAAQSEWVETVKKLYPDSAEYKISLYALFMDMGLVKLNGNGTFCYITPDSFLLGRYFSKLRARLLNSCHLKQFVMFEEDFWESGVVGRPTISVLQKTAARGNNKFEVRTILCRDVKSFVNRKIQEHSYQQSYFAKVVHNRFRLFFSELAQKFVMKMDHDSHRLGDYVRFNSGLIGRDGKEKIISDRRVGTTWRKGILSGGDVLPYCVRYAEKWINYDIQKLKSGFKDAQYEKPKLLMRQTGDSLIAAYDPNALYCLNNVHVGNKVSLDVDIRYVVALLNSELMNAYYRLISLETGRVMAQTDIDVVEELPFKLPSKEQEAEVLSLFNKIYEAKTDSSEYHQVKTAIELVLRRVYSVSSEFLSV